MNFIALDPKDTVLVTASWTLLGHVAVWPDGTAVTNVVVSVLCDVDCSDAGQFPVVELMHCTPVCFIVVVSVVVTRLARLCAETVGVADALALAGVGKPLMAQMLASSVFQMGMLVVATGPQVSEPKTMLAPAPAPSAIW